VFESLQSLIRDLHTVAIPGIAAPSEAGIDGPDCWIACEHVEGICAADWLAHNGRIPPAAVLEIARQMATALASLESRGHLHGDLGARQLILTKSGQAILPLPGVRPILRPEEGYTRLDLLPEAYDYLAPERISDGTPANIASELFACGCLWWHLLCGRPPLAGGDCLGKVRSAQQGRLSDVRRFAPDAPPVLVDAIVACTQLDPRRRPPSMAELAKRLGPADKQQRAALVRHLTPPAGPEYRTRKRASLRPPDASRGVPLPVAISAVLLVALGMGWWNRDRSSLPLVEIAGAPPAAMLTPEPVLAPANQPKAADAEELSNNGPADLVLPAGAVNLSELKLEPGQTVRGASGSRTILIVPADGLAIETEDVRFENIDFTSALPAADASRPAVLVQLRALRAAFHCCSFQALSGSSLPAIAIDWPGPVSPPRQTLQTGRLVVSSCVFHRIDRGIFFRGAGAIRIDLENSLWLAAGAWMTVDHLPRADEPILIHLTHATLRGGRALLESPSAGTGPAGEIQLRLEECALAPARGGALVALFGPQPEESFLRRLRISGQGTILSPEAPLAVWQGDYGGARLVPDEQIEAGGLVRTSIGFAGGSLDQPAAARVVHWQAPLVSPDPPGILDAPVALR
jgi:hypothetical protein